MECQQVFHDAGLRDMDSQHAYDELIRLWSRQSLLASCSALLGWDEQTYMPPGGAEHRGRQMALLDQITPLLSRLGIEVAPFGPDQLAVHAFPSFLHRLDPAEFVRELLERGEQELLDLHGEELLHEVLDMMSCKAAVKAGDPLTPAEIEALLARRELVERSSNCPHGRPTTLRLTLHDLEKQFKRTGF